MAGRKWSTMSKSLVELGCGGLSAALSGLARSAGSNRSHVFPERILPLQELEVVRAAWLC